MSQTNNSDNPHHKTVECGEKEKRNPLQTAATSQGRISEGPKPDRESLSLLTQTIHQAVSMQAAKRTDACAVVEKNRRITYGHLNRTANRWAHYLNRLGVGPEVPVCVCAERSGAAVLAFLAVMKAGGAYVPLDPQTPAERLEFMVRDSGTPVLLFSGERQWPAAGVEALSLDAPPEILQTQSDKNPPTEQLPETMAYVIYTSGSTGQPKGVRVAHRAAMRLFVNLPELAITADDRVGQVCNTIFDVSVMEIWGALTRGSQLVILSKETILSPENFFGQVVKNAISVLHLPTAIFHHLAAAQPDGFGNLRTTVFAGEAANPELVKAVLEAGPPKWLLNCYGPTENAVYSTCYRVTRSPSGPLSIGTTLAHSNTRITNQKLETVAPGDQGELCLGGRGLAQGYFKRPGLTAASFVPCPGTTIPGARLYKSGDLAAMGPEGIEYRGRLDFQVKIRGYRIELGEIETALMAHPAIQDALLLTPELAPGDKRLAAFVTPANTPAEEQLKQWLATRLPDYMVPWQITAIAKMPLSPSGKVDRKQLAALIGKKPGGKNDDHTKVAPVTALEKKLAPLWCQVLHLDEPDIQANFYHNGGHSLLATRLVSRVREGFQVELPIQSVFQNPTIAQLALEIERRLKSGSHWALPAPVPLRRKGQLLRLSFSQERLWFVDRLDPGAPTYNVPLFRPIKTQLNVSQLQQALQTIVSRHEILRTRFPSQEGKPRQEVDAPAERDLPLVDFSGLATPFHKQAVRRCLEGIANHRFNLGKGPLFQALLLRLQPTNHLLAANFHHIITDAWSLDLFCDELGGLYEEPGPAKPTSLPWPEIQYADFAHWQRQWLEGSYLENQLAFWRGKLGPESPAGSPPPLALPLDRQRKPGPQGHDGADHTFVMSTDLDNQLDLLAKEEACTPFMVFLATFKALLLKTTHQRDFTVGTPVAGRNHIKVEPLIGFFVNTLVLRSRLDQSLGMRALLANVRETVLEAFAHQDLPFEKLVEDLQPERSLNRNPLFQALFNFIQPPNRNGALWSGTTEEDQDFDPQLGGAKFEFSLTILDSRPRLVTFSYRKALFDKTTIARLSNYYLMILRGIAQDPSQTLAGLQLLVHDERKRLLQDWNDTATQTRNPGSLVDFVQDQARQVPDRVAVHGDGRHLSFGLFGHQINWGIHGLRKRGIATEKRVAIYFERQPELFSALFAVLGAGGCYLALDPRHPVKRIKTILSDSGANLVVSLPNYQPLLTELDVDIFIWDPMVGPAVSTAPVHLPVAANQLAYILYTSGSTGVPKGVMIRHGSLLNLRHALHRIIYGQLTRRVLKVGLHAPVTFDASVKQILTLLDGHSLYILPESDRLDGKRAVTYIERTGIQVMDCTPTLLELILAEGFSSHTPMGHILVGGEAPSTTLRKSMAAQKNITFHNVYGPTECTVDATHSLMNYHSPTQPLGQPLANMTTYLVDGNLQPVPIGVTGQLAIGGAGLARGYAERAALTATVFIPNPFAEEQGSRLYLTGDRAIFKTGKGGNPLNLVFLGRLDFQAKLRGLRLELGEIEAAVMGQTGVRECCALMTEVAREHSHQKDQHLVAYLVLEKELERDPEKLRRELAKELPRTHLPSVFVFLDAMPLTANGKVDRQSLPSPQWRASEIRAVTLPRDEVESTLASIWEEVLDRDRIGVSEGFFELGGHSLLAVHLAARIGDFFDITYPLQHIFEHPTIAAQARSLNRLIGSPRATPMGSAPRGESLLLSFGQQRLWLIDRLEPGSPVYNVPLNLEFQCPLEIEIMERSLNQVRHRHSALRTIFPTESGQVFQKIMPFEETVLLLIDLSGLPVQEREQVMATLAAAEARFRFHLARGPLTRFHMCRLHETRHLLLANFHHSVTDAWSGGIFRRDLAEIYDSQMRKAPPALPDLPVQYADFAHWQRARYQEQASQRSFQYWRRELGPDHPMGPAPVSALPTDYSRPTMETHGGLERQFPLKPSLSQALRTMALKQGGTPFTLLVTAFFILLARLTNQRDLCIGVPVAGRNHRRTRDLMGFFVNTVVLRCPMKDNPSFSELCRFMRAKTVKAIAHQDTPFDRLVEHLRPVRIPGMTPLFQVMFNLVDGEQPHSSQPGKLKLVQFPEVSGHDFAKFDLTLTVITSDTFNLVFDFKTDLFHPSSIEAYARQFTTLLEKITAAPDEPVFHYDLLTDPERRQVLHRLQSPAHLPKPPAVPDAFFLRSQQTPDRVACVTGTTFLSYGSLNRRAESLARKINRQFGGHPTCLGIDTRNFTDAWVARLAVLKAGGIYVPLNPNQPGIWNQSLCRDAGIQGIVTRAFEACFEGIAPVNPGIDDTTEQVPTPLPDPHHRQIAALTYLNQVTGEPIGLPITHDGITALEPISGNPCQKPLRLFVASGAVSQGMEEIEIWRYFLQGARLVTPGRTNRGTVPATIERERLETLRLGNSICRQLVDMPLPGGASLKRVIADPVNLETRLQNSFKSRFPQCRLIMTMDWAEIPTCNRPRQNDPESGTEQAQEPGPAAIVVDRRLLPVPEGNPGTLLAGGQVLAQGYWARPRFTASRFLPNPFSGSGEAGSRLFSVPGIYRMGTGNGIHYLDDPKAPTYWQGLLLDSSSLTDLLRTFPDLQEVEVMVRAGHEGKEILAAFYVGGCDGETLKQWTADRLPSAFVPTIFQSLPNLPRTPDGKLDRDALRRYPLPLTPHRAQQQWPETQTERRLADIWQDLLLTGPVTLGDNFFALGGHSLLAVQLLSRIQESLKVTLQLRAIFEEPTFSRMAQTIDQIKEAPRPIDPFQDPIPKYSLPPVLSFAQERMWFIDRLEPGSPAYNVPLVRRIEGPLDPGRVQTAISRILSRHSVLRSRFPAPEGPPICVVSEKTKFTLASIDFSGQPLPIAPKPLKTLLNRFARQTFHLETGPLFRFLLIRLSQRDHLFLALFHHTVTDAWSLDRFCREMAYFYHGPFKNTSQLPNLGIQYSDYARWQRQWLRGERLADQVAYWRNQLGAEGPTGPVPVLELPLDRVRPDNIKSRNGRHLEVPLSERLTRQIRSFSASRGTTPFTVMLAVFKVLLLRYSHQSDFSVGTPVSGRTQIQTEPLIGVFINTLVLRSRFKPAATFAETLTGLRETMLDALANQDLPFEKMVEALSPERDLGRTPLFQVLFNFLESPKTTEKGLAKSFGKPTSEFNPTLGITKFDLSLAVIEGKAYRLVLQFPGDLFETARMVRLGAHYSGLLKSFITEPNGAIHNQSLLTDMEKQELLWDWNQTAGPSPRHGDPLRLLIENAQRAPHRVAIVGAGRHLSYRCLFHQVVKGAQTLKRMGTYPEEPVGVCLGRCPEMIAAMFAVMRAGGCFVPLDPTQPGKRTGRILQTAGIRILLAKPGLAVNFPGYRGKVLLWEDPGPNLPKGMGVDLEAEPEPLALAYMIFTSGSTGRPKGVMIHRTALLNLKTALDEAVYRNLPRAPLKVGLNAPFVFDASVKQWLALLGGHTLVLIPDEVRLDGQAFAEFVVAHCLQIFDCTPSQLEQAAEAGFHVSAQLAAVLVGGESASQALRNRLATFRGTVFHNVYGPTECTVDATESKLPGDPGPAAIGKPLTNTSVYLLDPWLNPVPRGVVGQVSIAGSGLARGYLSNPVATATAFVPNPFSGTSGSRMYLSGDQARFQGEHDALAMISLGRADHQTKVRGIRIELGEIEAAISSQPGVHNCCVVVEQGTDRNVGSQRLLAYVVSDEELTPEQWRGNLEDELPATLIPNLFVPLSALPLTSNGKVDRGALPKPDWSGPAERPGVPPRDQVEHILADLWIAILTHGQADIYQDFFEAGGHSLLATRMIASVNQTLGVRLPLRSVFEKPTIFGLSQLVKKQLSESGQTEQPRLERADRNDHLPLSFGQQRLWFLERMNPGSAAYHVPFTMALPSPVSIGLFQDALNQMVARHEILRTGIVAQAGRPGQNIQPRIIAALAVIDLTGISKSDYLATILRRLGAHRFALNQPPLARWIVVQVAPNDLRFHAVFHHIITDAWSMNLFKNELLATYRARVSGEPATLGKLEFQYADYAAWQRQWCRGKRLELQLAYWKDQLGSGSARGLVPVLDLPLDRPRPILENHRGAVCRFGLAKTTSDQLRAFATRAGATPFMTLLATFFATCARNCGQQDFAIGIPVSGRHLPETEHLIGFFVNTLPIRCQVTGDTNFKTLLGQVRQKTLNALAHQDVPFDKLVHAIHPKRNPNRTPLFQVVFNFVEPRDQSESRTLATGQETMSLHAKFDLTLTLTNRQHMEGALEYKADLFEEATIQRQVSQFKRLLHDLIRDSEKPILNHDWLTDQDRRRILTKWNQTHATYPRDHHLPGLFEETVAAGPHRTAIVDGANYISYQMLNQQANGLAQRLQQLGVVEETRVGMLLSQSADRIVALLAIVKTGGVYVPMDPSYPKERIQTLIRDAHIRLLLSDTPVTGFQSPALCLETPAGGSGHKRSPDLSLPCEQLAYIMYTSGSTGTPKGVAITHRNVIRLVKGNTFARLNAGEVMLQAASISFDAATFEIWGSLLNGLPLVLQSEGALDRLGDTLQRHQISIVWLTAQLFHLMVDEHLDSLTGVRQILAGGDVVSLPHVQKFLRANPSIRLINGYGPTESTTFTCSCNLSEIELQGLSAPIGKPIANTRCYVVNRQLQPVAIGISGQLLIGGDGLARGYYNQATLTAERFIPNPFASNRESGSRLYQSGDRVRFLQDGNIAFLGRQDQQVKIRGYRVEPGEVASVLSNHPAVSQAAVLVRDQQGGNKILVAFSVGKASPKELTSYLEANLPGYMIPGAIIPLDHFPVTPNGKLDRKALSQIPLPETTEQGQDRHARPLTFFEETLASLWRRLLNVDLVNLADNFFDRGGHSLLAIQLVSRIRRNLGVQVPLSTIFQKTSLESMAAEIEIQLKTGDGHGLPSPTPIAGEAQDHPVSFSQERLWFIDRLDPQRTTYTVPLVRRFRGPLNLSALAQSLDRVLRRHDMLRTHFPRRDGKPRQWVLPFEPKTHCVVDGSGLDPSLRLQVAASLIRHIVALPFDLENKAPVRLLLLRLSSEDHLFLAVFHHIVIDAWSIDILFKELFFHYDNQVAGIENQMPRLEIQYTDFAHWQRRWLDDRTLKRSVKYWHNQLGEKAPKGPVPFLNLATDRPRGVRENRKGASLELTLKPDLSHAVSTLAMKCDATRFTVQLTAFSVLLSHHSGQRDFSIGVPIAGRSHGNTEPLLGFFVNTLAPRFNLGGNPRFGDLLGQVRQNLMQAFAHQDLPFEKLVEDLQPTRVMNRSPLFQAMFNFIEPATSARQGIARQMEHPPTTRRAFDPGLDSAKFELALTLFDEAPARLAFHYQTALLDRQTVTQMADRFLNILATVTKSPQIHLGSITVFSREERESMVSAWNQTPNPFSQNLPDGLLGESQFYLLDPALQPVPRGVPGLIARPLPAHRPLPDKHANQTAATLLPDPYATQPGGILTLTGHLALWKRSKGTQPLSFAYLGTHPQNVRMLGMPVSLFRIETTLQDMPGIRKARVIATGGSGTRVNHLNLNAYVETEDGNGVDPDSLKKALVTRLPMSHIPRTIEVLDRLPLDANGALDLDGLPASQETAAGLLKDIKPRDQVESQLFEIWQGLLAIDFFGIYDDFFELGGHSLLVTRLVSRINHGFQVQLDLRTAFENPTIASQAAVLKGLRSGTPQQDLAPMKRVSRKQNHPLSFVQRRLWFIDQMAPGDATYNVPMSMNYESPVDPSALEHALNHMCRRHEIMRIRIVETDGTPKQEILPFQAVPLRLIDLSCLPEATRNRETAHQIAKITQRPFDLKRGPLFHWVLLRLGKYRQRLLLTFHHMIIDAWSGRIYRREFDHLTHCHHMGLDPGLATQPIQYIDFAHWQHRVFSDRWLKKQFIFWGSQLGPDHPQGPPPNLTLPTDFARPPVATKRGAIYRFEIDEQRSRKVRALARQKASTPYVTLLASFAVLLARISQQRDFCVGTPIAGRSQFQLEPMIGFFVNMLVLRCCLRENECFHQWEQRLRSGVLDAFAHQDTPLDRLIEHLQPNRTASQSPLFQVAFNFVEAEEGLPTTPAGPGEPRSRTQEGAIFSKFDLTLTVVNSRSFAASLEFKPDLFRQGTIQRYSVLFERLLDGLLRAPEQSIWETDLLTDADRQTMLETWNQTGTPYPHQATLDELFDIQAARVPQATALVHENQAWTYENLQREVSGLAATLLSLGLLPDQRVGICMAQSPMRVVSTLAVIKAGGAYVPMDPSYPNQRLQFMARDAEVQFILSDQDQIKWPNLRTYTPGSEKLRSYSDAPIFPQPQPQRLAYIMYTSGSTGTPKGVAISHNNVVRLVMETNYADFRPGGKILQLASVSFDAATFEIWGSLLNGLSLVLLPEGGMDRLAEILVRHRIDLIFATAQLFHLLVDEHLSDLAGVRQLLAGGEVISMGHIRKFLQAHPQNRLINGYGPTEATTFAVCGHLRAQSLGGSTAPIGKPIANTTTYLVDGLMNAVPVGVAGELLIGGDGLARAYHRRPGLTAERFVPNPFATGNRSGSRLYRSGDLARYLENGSIEFLGRKDQQVKIRGFRVEPEEVSLMLNQHPQVERAATMVREDQPGQKQLVSYVVGKAEPVAIKQFLEERLPKYMIPAATVIMDQLPMTPNGKLDKQALPAAEIKHQTLEAHPRTPLERELASIWCRLLNLKRVEIGDNFFNLGGHSLLALRLISQIKLKTGKKIPLALLFREGTIASLAAYLESDSGESTFSCLVDIQPQGSKKPFFCVHPAGGNVLVYHDLAKRLGPNQPFYGLQSQGLDEHAQPQETIEAMARHYLTLVKSVQPSGPYQLGGWSLGGVVAFEMAIQLLAQGDSVGQLVLIDTWAPGSAALGTDKDDRALAAVAKDLGIPKVQLTFLEQRASGAKPFMHLVLTKAKKKGMIAEDTDVARMPKLYEVFKANYRALERYQPGPYQGPLSLFKSNLGTFAKAADATMGWQPWALGPTAVHQVPGTHLKMLKEPYVIMLAQKIKSSLA